MTDCGSCSGCGNASGCTGCTGCSNASTLELTGPEVALLSLLGQVAFLPVARKLGEDVPVCLEEGCENLEQTSLVLQCLEKKALISIDYTRPLRGASLERYREYPLCGSMGLTQRGQQVLELLEYQGIQEEA